MTFAVVAVAGLASVAVAVGTSARVRVSFIRRVTCASPYPASCPRIPQTGVAGVEFSLAADPVRPRGLLGAWIQNPPRSVVVGVSADGGRSWRLVVPPRLASCTGGVYLRSVDPWLSVGPDGVAYLGTVPITTSGAEAPAVQVSRSLDGGRRWSAPVFVDHRSGSPEADDKETVAADPFRVGNAYVNWQRLHVQRTTQGTFVSQSVNFSRTRDDGRTWSPPTTIDTPPAGWDDGSPQVVVPSRGVLVCVFSRGELAANHVTVPPGARVLLLAKRSLDGGRTWSRPKLIASERFFNLIDTERSTPIRAATTPEITVASGPHSRSARSCALA